MKKIIGLFTLTAALMAMSCTDKTTEVKKEVIVVPATVIIDKKAPEKNTTIKLDKNGVEVSTKKVDVEIKN